MRQLIGDYSVQELSDSAQQHGGLGYINLGNSTVDGGAEQRHHPRAAELLPNSQKCEKPVYSVGGDRSVHNRNGKTHLNGGEGGIRTPGRFNPSTVFKTAAFDHSANSPWGFAWCEVAEFYLNVCIKAMLDTMLDIEIWT